MLHGNGWYAFAIGPFFDAIFLQRGMLRSVQKSEYCFRHIYEPQL